MGAHTLTVEEMPSHNHTGITVNQVGSNGLAVDYGSPTRIPAAGIGYTGGSESHTHSLTNVTSNSTSSLPLYYSLSLIMRVA